MLPGLNTAEVQTRQAQYGKNVLIEHHVSGWSIFIRQFKSSFVYLLLAAAILAMVLGEYIDGGMIIVFVLVNALLGFWQEFKSEKTSQLLKQLTMNHARVRRNGEVLKIPSQEIVPGDLIILEAGDIICADAKVVQATGFQVNETVLTGESVPITKTADTVIYSATSVVTGEAEAEVTAIGQATEMGKVAKLTTDTKRVSSFEVEINHFSSFILRLVLITLVAVLASHLIFKAGSTNVVDLLIFAVALAVGVIPEALPVVTTFSLSRGAQRLAKQKVVVKRLTAIEDLGSIEVLCTDKTGTITENKLSVVDTQASDPTKALWFAAAAGDMDVQDPFDVALLKALDATAQTEVKQVEVLNEIPFDPERKRNSVLVKHQGKQWLIVRGAPEVVMNCCDHLHQEECNTLLQWIDTQGKQGRRVLGVAIKELTSTQYTVEDELKGATYLGAIAFADPIKASTKQAIEHAKVLGVQVKVITGDSAAVAGSVAHQVGLVSSNEHVITGQELLAMSESDQHEAVQRYHVFARVAPTEKFHIIKLLQSTHQVGFLGEGINDAPALKIANVGLVVNNASDIARESADVILLDQSLEVIIDGIREGRAVFANTIKYIQATLSSNFGNFYAVAIVSLFIDFLPMLPLQILLVNLLSDFPMITIAADRVDQAELQHPKTYHVRDILLLATILGLVSTAFDFMYFAVFQFGTPSQLQTNWFIGSILTELLFLFSIRNRGFLLRGTKPAPIIMILSAVAAVATIWIPFTHLGQTVFQFTAPTANDLGIILSIAAGYLVVTETVKLTYYRYTRHA